MQPAFWTFFGLLDATSFQNAEARGVREFWWIWDTKNNVQARDWARRFRARWWWAAPEMVEKFKAELEGVLAFFTFPAQWRHRLRTTNLGEGWFTLAPLFEPLARMP